MSIVVKIARDGGGIRLQLEDPADLRIVELLGPWDITDEGDKIHFTPSPTGNNNACTMGDGIVGLRSGDDNGESMQDNRFSPWQTEVDLYNEDGFTVEVPPIHWLPWPVLKFCEGYCYRSQLVRCIAERIKSKAQEDNKSVAVVSRNYSIPMNLRRELSGATREQLLLELAA